MANFPFSVHIYRRYIHNDMCIVYMHATYASTGTFKLIYIYIYILKARIFVYMLEDNVLCYYAYTKILIPL